MRRSILSRGEAFFLLVGTPVLFAVLVVEAARIWKAINGEPLLITGLGGFDISVQWSAGPLPFILGAVLHTVIIAFVTCCLCAQIGVFKLWLRARRHRA